MMEQLPSLTKLLKQLQAIPYLASKNMYRVADYFMALDQERLHVFLTTLQEMKKNCIRCSICCSWKERDRLCVFCDSPKRDKKIICVVETWHDLCALERTAVYQGVYHVLGGVLCPLDGIGPDQLTIVALMQRIAEQGCDELVLAMNQTPEGEATAAFLHRRLRERVAKITCLARGVPVGSLLESIDRVTVSKALNERRVY